MDLQAHVDATVGATFADGAGPLTGFAATFVCTAVNQSTGLALVVSGVTEEPAGSGYYQATIDASELPGRMRLLVTFANTVEQLYSEAFYSVGDMPSWARTRREARRRIAGRLFMDEHIWDERATDGTTTTCILPGVVLGALNEFRGLWLWFGTGANRNQSRQVTAYNTTTHAFTFAPALPAAVAANDRVEVYPLRPDRLNDAIDDAISDLKDTVFAQVEERIIQTDGVTSEWRLPSDAAMVYNVGLCQRDTGEFVGWLPLDMWSLLPGGLLRVGGWGVGWSPFGETWRSSAPIGPAAGSVLRVLLLVHIEPPLYDDSTIDIQGDALIDLATFRLAMDMGAQMKDRWPFLERQATVARRRARTTLPPAAQEVPA
jgi:hypothetical protein